MVGQSRERSPFPIVVGSGACAAVRMDKTLNRRPRQQVTRKKAQR